MPDNEKNRLGDKLRDLEKGREDQYFQRRDRELIEKLRVDKASARETACPNCGATLSLRPDLETAGGACPACGWKAPPAGS